MTVGVVMRLNSETAPFLAKCGDKQLSCGRLYAPRPALTFFPAFSSFVPPEGMRASAFLPQFRVEKRNAV